MDNKRPEILSSSDPHKHNSNANGAGDILLKSGDGLLKSGSKSDNFPGKMFERILRFLRPEPSLQGGLLELLRAKSDPSRLPAFSQNWVQQEPFYVLDKSLEQTEFLPLPASEVVQEIVQQEKIEIIPFLFSGNKSGRLVAALTTGFLVLGGLIAGATYANLSPSTARTSMVHMKNGSVFIGTITHQVGSDIVIRTSTGGLGINPGQIRSIEHFYSQ